MFLLFGGVVMLVVTNVLCQEGENGGVEYTEMPQHQLPDNELPKHHPQYHKSGDHSAYQIPHTFVDVFKPGMNGKPILGTPTSTCWARGGICVPIKQCPSFRMDIAVPGCSWGYMVCCKIHTSSPTVGTARKNTIPHINNLDELGTPLEIIGLRNAMLMASWQSDKSKSDDKVNIYLGDLMN